MVFEITQKFGIKIPVQTLYTTKIIDLIKKYEIKMEENLEISTKNENLIEEEKEIKNFLFTGETEEIDWEKETQIPEDILSFEKEEENIEIYRHKNENNNIFLTGKIFLNYFTFYYFLFFFNLF